ncbi:BTAD domain-containing putative transcriptional regulator [Umezawaea sp. Da 62-37]|uniref:AfsR/SARP family transcriptional regulator n=1 Tax=Umezawaea sp. Da 62-37 TaxID=3075927 RepID=UPI0028F714C3|nr:BTAD domain-containing putative transcriptional regulator [Umezawaea sp. Da 62-37]WNV87580.1 BTAD domain-containing putative transcriptional regulator [Umezawaea sp. Da 62-37]
MDYRILGPLEASHDEVVVDISGARQLTVLALLLVEANRIVPVDRLVDGVWNETPPATSRSQIHICISSLRRQLAGGGASVDTCAPGYRLRVAEGELDLHVFEARVAAAHAAVADGAHRRAVVELRSALALWRGPALAGVGSQLLRRVAAALDDRRLAVHEECLEIELAHGLGAPHDLVCELTGLVAARPRRERLLALLMIALYRVGRQAEALEEYRRARARFIGELGIEPGEELSDLYQRILVHDPALSRPAEPPPVPVRSRGPRRLPADIADFTGRRRSLERLLEVSEPQDGTAVRTVEVTGREGVGKTTLVVHAGHLLAPEFPDGQLFARLSHDGVPEDPHDILGRFLRAFGFADQDVPDGREERAETYRDHMADRRVLVVLDDALSESQVFPLLPGSSLCRVLVTSRRPLAGLPAAVRLRLTPFTEDSALELAARIAGRARIDADRDAAVALNEACGYLPLALRLAAARLASHPHWTVADVVAHLEDGSSWLDDLEDRTGVHPAYAGLTDEARRLFRLLPLVDAADFASWVGAPLLDVGVARSEALLDELADADLLVVRPHAGGTRYWMPGWILGYARRRQSEEGEESVRKAFERLLGALLHLSEKAHRLQGGEHLHLAGNGASRWELPAPLVERLVADPAGWYTRERSWVLRAVRQAAAAGFPEHAWGLAMCTVTFAESSPGALRRVGAF